MIEVMVAFAILSIGMLGIGKMLVDSLQSDKTSQRTRLGDTVAMTRYEIIKHMALEQNVLDESVFSDGPFVVDVEVVSHSPCSDITRVIIRVGWGGSRCKTQNVKSHRLDCKYVTEASNFITLSQ